MNTKCQFALFTTGQTTSRCVMLFSRSRWKVGLCISREEKGNISTATHNQGDFKLIEGISTEEVFFYFSKNVLLLYFSQSVKCWFIYHT